MTNERGFSMSRRRHQLTMSQMFETVENPALGTRCQCMHSCGDPEGEDHMFPLPNDPEWPRCCAIAAPDSDGYLKIRKFVKDRYGRIYCYPCASRKWTKYLLETEKDDHRKARWERARNGKR